MHFAICSHYTIHVTWSLQAGVAPAVAEAANGSCSVCWHPYKSQSWWVRRSCIERLLMASINDDEILMWWEEPVVAVVEQEAASGPGTLLWHKKKLVVLMVAGGNSTRLWTPPIRLPKGACGCVLVASTLHVACGLCDRGPISPTINDTDSPSNGC